MTCVVICASSVEEASAQIEQALPYADLVELRLDYFQKIDIEPLKWLLQATSLPMIFTLREARYEGSEEMRLAQIEKLAELLPAYLDLESHL